MTKYIYRVDYIDDYHHRTQTYGGMDSEYSHTTREPTHDFILSTSQDIDTVRAIWDIRNKYRPDIEVTNFEQVGYANYNYDIGTP